MRSLERLPSFESLTFDVCVLKMQKVTHILRKSIYQTMGHSDSKTLWTQDKIQIDLIFRRIP